MSNAALNFVFDLDVPIASDKLVMIALADRTNDKLGGLSWPSLPRIMAMTSLSRKTAQRALDRVIAAGLVEIVEPPRGRRSTRYRIVGRGITTTPLAATGEASPGPVEASPGPGRGVTMTPEPLVTLKNPPTASDVVEWWAAITSTPLTTSVRRRWIAQAAEILAVLPPLFEGRLQQFLEHAAREGCRSLAGLPHFAASYRHELKLAGAIERAARDAAHEAARLGNVDTGTFRTAAQRISTNQVDAAMGRRPGETTTDMIRRLAGGETT